MKITLSQADLNHALQVTQRAVSSKSILPILSGILFSIDGEYLDLCATDLEVSIKYRLRVNIENLKHTEAVVVPARLIGDIVKNLPDSKIELFIDNKSSNMKLSCGSSYFDIKTLPSEDFPSFPETQTDKSISINSKKLSEIIKQVIKAVSKDETRPVLCGILTTIEKGRLKMVTTDSYRLSMREISIEGTTDEEIKVIIPARCMDEISKIQGDGDVEIGPAKNQIFFKTDNVTIVSRLIEGNFPNYQQLLPTNCEVRVKLIKNEFMNSLRRASLLAQNNSLVKIKIVQDKVQISSFTADIGSAVEEVKASVDGEGMEAAFNAHYLIDGLNSIVEDEVYLELNSPLKPGIVRPVELKDFIYLVMPVRIG